MGRLKQSSRSVPPDAVTMVVHQNHARSHGGPVRDFVPLFVEGGARQVSAKPGG
ncbi:three-helix bundle dimerization domain-containing protein [Mycobacterium sp.]|uniref:three-helix bundle dimerization domain-containing protein n=1 Tax=Mycobacterium sp. TaxID=1785 RepID=UPI0039C95D4A